MDLERYRAAARLFFADEHLTPLGQHERVCRVPLRARLRAVEPPRGQTTDPQPDNTVPALELLASLSDRTLLVGPPGSGKTTVLWQFARALADAPEGSLPIFVPLRSLDDSFDDLKNLIVECARRVDPSAPTSADAILTTNAFTILFDGLNECASRRAYQHLERLWSSFPRTRMTFSTREADSRFGAQVDLLALDRESRDSLIGAWVRSSPSAELLRARIAEYPKLDELSRLPLMLSLICRSVEDETDIGHSRVQVLRGFARQSTTYYAQVTSRRDANRTTHQLEQLAYTMTCEGVLEIDDSDAAAVFQGQGAGPVELEQLVGHPLLARSPTGRLLFIHQLIQEFFAAERLKQDLPLRLRTREADEILNSTAWTESILFVAEEVLELAVAQELVRRAGRIDRVLAARIVGSLAEPLAASVYAVLLRPDDNVGTRLHLAELVGTSAALDDLKRIASSEIEGDRSWVCEVLWTLKGAGIAELNSALLADSSLQVLGAAAHNLERHPAPADVLITTLQRDDVWLDTTYVIRQLLPALLASDTEEAAAFAKEIARKHLVDWCSASPTQISTRVSEVFARGGHSPTVAQALLDLVPEFAKDDERLWTLLNTLSRQVVPIALDATIRSLPYDGLTDERTHAVISRLLRYSDSFTISDELLLDTLQSSFRELGFFRHPLLKRVVERGCRGLDEFLALIVEGAELPPSQYYDGASFIPILATINLSRACVAIERAMNSDDEHIRIRAMSKALNLHIDGFEEFRSRALSAAYETPELARQIAGGRDLEAATNFVREALARSSDEVRATVIQTVWGRYELAPVVSALRENRRSALDPFKRGHQQCSTELTILLAHTILHGPDLELRESFLVNWSWRFDDPLCAIVVGSLGIIVDSENDAASPALRHLYATTWRPKLSLFVELLRNGGSPWRHCRESLTADELHLALRPLIENKDTCVQERAVDALLAVGLPERSLDEFAALLAEPSVALPVACALLHARSYKYFLAIVGLEALFELEPAKLAEYTTVRPSGVRRYYRLHPHDLERPLEEAPDHVFFPCLRVLSTRGHKAWRHVFLNLFEARPSFEFRDQIVARARELSFATREAPLRALVRCAKSRELAALDAHLDVEDEMTTELTRALAEETDATYIPLAMKRLERWIYAEKRPWGVCSYLARFFAREGSLEEARRLLTFARRVDEVAIARNLYQAAAEIQQRCRAYNHLRLTMSPFVLLHLSDLHFSAPDEGERWYSALAQDLSALGIERLDALVLSGDIADRGGTRERYAVARDFLERLSNEFGIERRRVAIVPGNHDVDRSFSERALERVPVDPDTHPIAFDYQHDGAHYKILDQNLYQQRLRAYAVFFEGALGRSFSLDPAEQYEIVRWPTLRTLVLSLSSVGELDHIRPSRATINDLALSRALDEIRQDTEIEEFATKIAVFHHPLNSDGEDRILDHGFLERLADAGFTLVLHGHVHKSDNTLFRYDRQVGGRRIEIVGAGTFGARAAELRTAIPWQYNILRFEPDRTVRVETRRREARNGPWKPDARWLHGADSRAWYTLDLRLT